MIGLVVVSHSRNLAEAAVALASEMVDGADLPPIAVAAGLDATTFGTDAAAVAAAIGEVDSVDGVLVLLDLGSAVLSAEMALEFLDPEAAERVVVSSAPLVEGLVAAVVLASTGAPIEAVAEEAARALAAKQDHLGEPAQGFEAAAGAGNVGQGPAALPDATCDVEVTNAHGLHARPAAQLVSLVRSFDALVTLTNLRAERGPVDAASLSRVATLNARRGDRLRVAASGPDADAALAAVRDLAARGFGDKDAAATQLAGRPRPAQTGSGLDIAIGLAVVPTLDIDTSGYDPSGVDDELTRSRHAVDVTSTALEQIRDETLASIGDVEADIFDAQLALLSDPSVGESVDRAVRNGTPAPDAWSTALEALAADFEALDDPYQRARAQDVRSVQRRILAALTGQVAPGPSTVADCVILLVPELDAATAATLDPATTVGVATRHGGATGHGVIVARSRGVPIITDVGGRAADVRTGDLVAFDARTGEFVADPGESDQARFRTEIAGRKRQRAGALSLAAQPAVTRDGCRVTVTANVTSVDDALAAAHLGAEGSGLVRTEILFGGHATLPGVERQAETFLAVAAALGGRPITIRTWDVGGDKPLRFLPQPVEANPFLGERGLRLFRRRPEVLREQLKAVCLTAQETPTKVMFPMVSTLEEVSWALDQLRVAAETVVGRMPSGLEVGIMVEVPAAALRAGRLAAELDFVSIGTNDLAQYTTAADRANTAVSGLADALEPAVLGLVGDVCAGVPERVVVAVCGDLASNEAAAALLVGLGVRELSAVAPAVPSVKAAIRTIDLPQSRDLARRALASAGALDVRRLLTPVEPAAAAEQ